MGLLNEDYFETLSKKAPAPAAPANSAVPAPDDGTPAPVPQVEGRSNPSPVINSARDKINQRENINYLSDDEQIQKYGAVVGSDEYYKNRADKSFVSRLPTEFLRTVGLQFPDGEEWDKMSNLGKQESLRKAAGETAVRMVTGLPGEIVKAPIRAVYSIAQPWARLAKGEDIGLDALSKQSVQVPWLGEVHSYFRTFKEAQDSGMGPLASTLMTGGLALGDVTVVGSLGEAATVAFRPRVALKPGETIKNTQPIQSALDQSQAKTLSIKKPEGSVSEYYTLPKETAKKFGGATNDTYFKVTPAGTDSVEISVVQRRSGVIPRTIDYIKDKVGSPNKVYTGDFGPEMKIQSQIIKIKPEETGAVKNLSTLSEEEAASVLGSIPPKPLKGFEKAPVKQDQLTTLDKITQINGIEPSIRDAIVRVVTGKNVIGEMTQADFVQVAQTLSRFNNMGKYAPDAPGVNMIAQYGAPQRHWMRSYEEKSGIPLYSEVYAPMEDAVRLRDVFRDSYRNEAREIFGKYAADSAEAGEGRRLISAYMRGEKEAILSNSTLSAEAKAELVAIADKMRAVYDRVGPLVDVPTDVFLKDYQPRVQNIGGIYQMYKEGAEIPKQLEFFGKFKRKGNLQGVQVDDALALFDIYINSGSNRTFLNPVLERASALAEKLPPNLHGSIKTYVQEKLGYAGKMEQFLDSFVPGINKRLGINLPEDAARQLTNLGLSSLYSGLLSSPATWFRQTFQYPLFGYARLGPKYAGEAIRKALTKEGLKEAREAGVLVDLGVPYGEELAKDITLGGRAANTYRKATQTIIKPNSMADNGMRSIVYHQSKLQWDDALARYNSGKITWSKLEEELDFKAFSPVDQNIIRQKLVSGDMDGAFRNFVREIVDETNFPYRKAASARITYGLGGKLGTSLLQWPLEAATTMSRWVKTGQWDKVIRFAGASTAIQRTMQESFGFDFTKSLFLGPFNNFYSPFVKTALDATNAFTAFMKNDKEEFNRNAESIVRTLRVAVPAGVEIQNVRKFMKSYEAGPDANGQYAVKNEQGEISYYTDFYGIFWGQLMGFPTEEKVENQNITQDIKNAQFDRTQTKQRVLELYQQEKYDEASELMAESGIAITPKDLDDYYIPYNERLFQSLPGQLKAQFAPRVYKF